MEMKGSEEAWVKLQTKFNLLKKYLRDIEEEIGLKEWWQQVDTILRNLLEK